MDTLSFFPECFFWLVILSYLPQTLQQGLINLLEFVTLMLKITGLHQVDKCLMLIAAHCFCVEKPNPGIKAIFGPKGKTLTFTFTLPACRYCISEQYLDTECMKHID